MGHEKLPITSFLAAFVPPQILASTFFLASPTRCCTIVDGTSASEDA